MAKTCLVVSNLAGLGGELSRSLAILGFEVDIQWIGSTAQYEDRYDLILNAADVSPLGLGDVSRLTEREAIRGLQINSFLPAELALRARSMGAAFVNVSTAWVFGTNHAHDVDEEPRPIQAYGVSKWWGERASKALYPDTVTVRVGEIVSPTMSWYTSVHEVMREPRRPVWGGPEPLFSFMVEDEVAVRISLVCLRVMNGTAWPVEHLESPPISLAEYVSGAIGRPCAISRENRRGTFEGVSAPSSLALIGHGRNRCGTPESQWKRLETYRAEEVHVAGG